MLVKNNYFANEDNDHEGKQNKTNIKKSIIPYNHNVYNIIPFVRDFFGGPVVFKSAFQCLGCEFNLRLKN